MGATCDAYFSDRTILSARNDNVNEINAHILNLFPGEKAFFQGENSVGVEEGHGIDAPETIYPVEYLESINCSGLPLSKLELLLGCLLMILCNLDPANDLCNGHVLFSQGSHLESWRSAFWVESMLERRHLFQGSPLLPQIHSSP